MTDEPHNGRDPASGAAMEAGLSFGLHGVLAGALMTLLETAAVAKSAPATPAERLALEIVELLAIEGAAALKGALEYRFEQDTAATAAAAMLYADGPHGFEVLRAILGTLAEGEASARNRHSNPHQEDI